jgi:predicted transcriptional regulator
MSREHFHESQIEDRVSELMEKGMSDEDAIQQAESEYDGQVNLVEEQALRIHEKAFEMNKEDIQKKLKQGCYSSEIVLSKVVEHLQANCNSSSKPYSPEQLTIKFFCRHLLTEINNWTLEVANAE